MAKFESITGRIIFGKVENFNDHKIECLKHQLNVCYYLLISRNLEPFYKKKKQKHKQSKGHKLWVFALKLSVQKAKTEAEDDMQLTKKNISSLFYSKKKLSVYLSV